MFINNVVQYEHARFHDWQYCLLINSFKNKEDKTV